MYCKCNIVFMKLRILFLCAIALLQPCASFAYVDRANAVVRIMNKAAGKVQVLNLGVGQKTKFEKLEITVQACKQSDPFDAENYFAFIEVSDADHGKIFSNWMDANEPGNNPLQNADYDLWLVKCE